MTKQMAIVIFLAIAVTVALIGASTIWGLLEANRWIDLCADNSHPDYIQDKIARDKACK